MSDGVGLEIFLVLFMKNPAPEYRENCFRREYPHKILRRRYPHDNIVGLNEEFNNR